MKTHKKLFYRFRSILIHRYYFLVFIFLIIFGCRSGKNFSEGENRISQSLKERITAYYELEKNEDWERTYRYRPEYFQDSVPIETYCKYMREDNNGWNLLKFKIIDSINKISVAMVKIAFTERSNSFGTIDIIEDTKWEKVNDEWFCIDCGVRTHLTMNTALVRRNDEKHASVSQEK